MKVVIPAAGRGTRFQHLNLPVPKELLPLGGVPLLTHALREAASAKFEGAVVVVSPEKQPLIDYLARGEHPLAVEIAVQHEPLGLADAVRVGAQQIRGEPFGVLLPDDVITHSEHWRALLDAARDGAAALTLREVPDNEVHRFGIAECRPEHGFLRVDRLIEKPRASETSSSLAILGRYLVSIDVAARLSHVRPGAIGEMQLTDAFAAVVEMPPGVVAIRFEGELYDCGTPPEYERSQARYRERNPG